ncbi:hypothetical protein BRADI_4g19065v3 [Brachypodium distachyon]|uniref:DUF7597 domain-containing protein n=1 Tax=Brachypodium distachyon TaxID=15368 RepID=A0A0Q3ELT9_BRADI|nr:hypothetical protein BRADI_4g19065v3 [Brachypodium distachyon]
MANFPVDPAPFLLGRFDIVEVPGHPEQCRYHVIGNVPTKNEDVTIVTMFPPPNPDAPFHDTRENLLAFLDGHLSIHVDYMQRSTLGHAIIRFTTTSDRHWLVLHGPHHHNGTHYVFTEHNRGINWRAFAYNREVWLMLLNLPLDLWETAHVNAAVAKWGKLISWDKTVSNLTRAVIKVRVESLADIPFSIQVSHGNDFTGESWTVPIYIVSQRLMGIEPPEEDAPPNNGDTPHSLPALPFHQDHGQHAPVLPDLNENVMEWQPWPAPPANNAHQNIPEDPLLAQNLMNLFHEEQNQANEQVINNDPNQAPDQEDESAITLTLSSNAPDQASEGSINQLQHLPALQPNLPEMEVNDVAFEVPQVIQEFPALLEIDIHQPQMEKIHITDMHTHTVTIPGPWIDFFTAMLASPDNFDWARKVLMSNMWSIFAASNDFSRPFFLRDTCPSKMAPVCKLAARVIEASQGFSIPQAPKGSVCMDEGLHILICSLNTPALFLKITPLNLLCGHVM